MTNRANRALIGLFIIGAIALLVALVIVLGAGWFAAEKTFVMYFQGSVMGLNRGSPVMFKGVRVGSVSNIAVRYDPSALLVLVPVYVEVDTGLIDIIGEEKPDTAIQLQPLIAKGFRAQLQMQSYVTGQLVVALDFFPGTPVNLVGIDKRYTEIPTVPTRVEELSRTLRDLPLEELSRSLLAIARGIEKLVATPGLEESVKSLNRTLERIGKLADNIEARVGPLMESMTKTSETVRKTVTYAQHELEKARIQETVSEMRKAAHEADNLFATARELISKDSRLVYDMETAMEDLAAAARSIRAAADYIERNPEALIRGKRGP
jgi:paraquat-inducible protein B